MTIKDEMSQFYPALLAAFLGIAIGINSLYFYTAGLFIKPLQAEFEWSRSAISSISFFGAMLSAAASPFVGAITDKFGVRLVAGICLLIFASCFYLLSGISGFATFFIFSLALQLFGTGTGPIVFSRLVNQNFDKARGFALGLSLAGTGLTGALAPRFLAGYIEDESWREAYKVLALIVLIFTPIVLVLAGIKRTGAGKQPSKDESLYSVQVVEENNKQKEYGLSFSEARKTSALWMLCALFFFVSLAIGGLIMHLVPLLTDAGVALKEAATIAGVLGVSVVFGRIAVGLLLDRFFAPYVAFILFSITAFGLVLLMLGGAKFAVITAICMGFSMGGETDLIAYFAARYFGLKFYSKIYGVIYALFMLGMSFSAILTGFIFDINGSYFYSLLCSAVFLGISCFICLRLPVFPVFSK